MHHRSNLFLIAPLIALATLVACGGNQVAPTTTVQGETHEQSAFAAPIWGVDGAAYSGGPASGPYLYAMCNQAVYNAPASPDPSCYGGAPVLAGVKTFTNSDSVGSSNPC